MSWIRITKKINSQVYFTVYGQWIEIQSYHIQQRHHKRGDTRVGQRYLTSNCNMAQCMTYLGLSVDLR